MLIIRMTVENTSAGMQAFGGALRRPRFHETCMLLFTPGVNCLILFLIRSSSRVDLPLRIFGKVSRSQREGSQPGPPVTKLTFATTSLFTRSKNSSPSSLLRHISCFLLPVSMAITRKSIALAHCTKYPSISSSIGK